MVAYAQQCSGSRGLAVAALVAGRAAAGGGASPHDLTIFTVASDVQFINTADDRRAA